MQQGGIALFLQPRGTPGLRSGKIQDFLRNRELFQKRSQRQRVYRGHDQSALWQSKLGKLSPGLRFFYPL